MSESLLSQLNALGLVNVPAPVLPFGTGAAPPQFVVNIDELLASHGAVTTQEAADKLVLTPLLNETRETLRPQMFEWAAKGFPPIYVVQQFTVSPPAVCSDGVARSVYDYVVYLLGQEMGPTIAAVQAMCVGVQISYSFQGNTLRIHVSRM
jgi:hypothetical protein